MVKIPQSLVINNTFPDSWWHKYWLAKLWMKTNPLARGMNTKLRYHFREAGRSIKPC